MNLWRDFLGILPREPLLIGTIASVDAARGTALVMLPGGGALTVRGTGAVGAMVFVRDGEIRGTAQGLTAIADLDV